MLALCPVRSTAVAVLGRLTEYFINKSGLLVE